MDIRNCKRCGKMYAYAAGLPICDQCKQKDEDDFQAVKNYINEHRGAALKDVSEACEVSIEKITRFLKEGRLEIKEGSNILLECENCGASIKMGRYCPECSKKLERELTKLSSDALGSAKRETSDSGDEKKKGGMRYLKS